MNTPPADRSNASPAARHAEPATHVLTVFYDGGCPLCATEIGFYRRRRGHERVCWLDVSETPADQLTPGLTRDQALKRFHVRQGDGRLLSGGQAFAALWAVLPGFSWLGRAFRLGPLAWAIDRAYDAFLRWRPMLLALARRASTPR